MREKIEEFQKKTDIATASSMYGEMNDFIAKTETLFLEDTKPIGVLVLLTAISQSYDLEADIRYIGNVKAEEPLWPYTKFEVSLKGEPQEIYKLLKDIEVQEKLITVESFSIKEEEETFTSKMILRFFY